MTMNLGFGFDAEVNYRQERLRADFGRTHGTNKPRGWQGRWWQGRWWQGRWWQRRPAAAVAGHRTPTAVAARHGAKAVTASTVEVAPVPVEAPAGRSRAARSTDVRAHAA